MDVRVCDRQTVGWKINLRWGKTELVIERLSSVDKRIIDGWKNSFEFNRWMDLHIQKCTA